MNWNRAEVVSSKGRDTPTKIPNGTPTAIATVKPTNTRRRLVRMWGMIVPLLNRRTRAAKVRSGEKSARVGSLCQRGVVHSHQIREAIAKPKSGKGNLIHDVDFVSWIVEVIGRKRGEI
jgi:hypothetical protein